MNKLFHKTSLVITCLILFSCSKTCDYNSVKMSVFVDGNKIQEKEYSDCFCVEKQDEGSLKYRKVKGDATGEQFFISYYDDGVEQQLENKNVSVLSMLNVKLGEKTSEWRAKKGHLIFETHNNDSTIFFFADPVNKENSVSGTIKFFK